MQDGQKFEAVQGAYKELKAPRGTPISTQEEIKRHIEEATQKIGANSPWCDPHPATDGKSSRGGDKSCQNMLQSSNSILAPPYRDTATISYDNADLDESRSTEVTGNGEDSPQIRDRPPVEEDNESDKKESRHAMVCLSGRVDKKGKLFFFLQNSWNKMPLVEVSLNYLIAAEASISSVSSKKVQLFFKKLMEENCFYGVNQALGADCSYPSYSLWIFIE